MCSLSFVGRRQQRSARSPDFRAVRFDSNYPLLICP